MSASSVHYFFLIIKWLACASLFIMIYHKLTCVCGSVHCDYHKLTCVCDSVHCDYHKPICVHSSVHYDYHRLTCVCVSVHYDYHKLTCVCVSVHYDYHKLTCVCVSVHYDYHRLTCVCGSVHYNYCKLICVCGSALTLEDEKRVIAHLLCGFISCVSFGRDFEQQLSFYVEARASFSNLDPVLVTLIQVNIHTCVVFLSPSAPWSLAFIITARQGTAALAKFYINSASMFNIHRYWKSFLFSWRKATRFI